MSEELQQAFEPYPRVLQVLTIFNEFFGEDKVDLQRGARDVFAFILVHFPRVKVTNEYDKYTFVNHLYAKVQLDAEGKLVGRFLLNRAEYTVQHFTNNYMHSHINSIPVNDFTQFQSPCTGSGPINRTICSLNRTFDEDLWRLFCLELDRYVQVESIAGTPYHRLEQLSDRRRGMSRASTDIQYRNNLDGYTLGGGGLRNNLLSMPQIAAFTKYLIDSNTLKFTYAGDKYQLAMSPMEFLILVSNLFIKWYNKEFARRRATASFTDLKNKRILRECKLINGQLFEMSNYQSDLLNFSQHAGKVICLFKGEPVRISFSDSGSKKKKKNIVIILNPNIPFYIITKILNVINFRYGNNEKSPNEKGIYYL